MLSHCWIVQSVIGHVLTHDGGCGGLAVVGGKSQMPSRKRWGSRARLWEEASDAHWLCEWRSITCRNIGTLGNSTSMNLLSVMRVIEDGLLFSVSSLNFTSPEHLLSCCALVVSQPAVAPALNEGSAKPVACSCLASSALTTFNISLTFPTPSQYDLS
jgi:hypothetical protein